MKGKQIDGEAMRLVGDLLRSVLPEGLGFMLMTFETGDSDTPANYLSNCDRADMIKELKEMVVTLEQNKDFKTFEKGELVKCIQCDAMYPDTASIRLTGCTCGGIVM